MGKGLTWLVPFLPLAIAFGGIYLSRKDKEYKRAQAVEDRFAEAATARAEAEKAKAEAEKLKAELEKERALLHMRYKDSLELQGAGK
ncbi:MAG: hypothetical protein FJZ01_24345 [Candidatus Sericytochromatia bacterium]|nr:hypothetical protein [Candidatus Tanganyikabacteria bacterium]